VKESYGAAKQQHTFTVSLKLAAISWLHEKESCIAPWSFIRTNIIGLYIYSCKLSRAMAILVSEVEFWFHSQVCLENFTLKFVLRISLWYYV